MTDYEIWAYRAGDNDVQDHMLLLDGLDQATAGIIIEKMTRNIIIGGVIRGGVPSVTVYIRKAGDSEYVIRADGRAVRTRYSHDCARGIYDYYIRTLRNCRRKIRIELVMIKNAHVRSSVANVSLLGILLCGDPVYGADVAPARANARMEMRHYAPIPRIVAPPIPRIVAPPIPRIVAPPIPRIVAPPIPRSLEALYAIIACVDVAALRRKLIRINKDQWKPVFDFIKGRRPRRRIQKRRDSPPVT